MTWSLRPVALSAALSLGAFLSGCRAPDEHPRDGPTAECPVCKHEGDLACVCVQVEPDTPRCECSGRVYYFCSDECREDFEAHPERYSSSVPER